MTGPDDIGLYCFPNTALLPPCGVWVRGPQTSLCPKCNADLPVKDKTAGKKDTGKSSGKGGAVTLGDYKAAKEFAGIIGGTIEKAQHVLDKIKKIGSIHDTYKSLNALKMWRDKIGNGDLDQTIKELEELDKTNMIAR